MCIRKAHVKVYVHVCERIFTCVDSYQRAHMLLSQAAAGNPVASSNIIPSITNRTRGLGYRARAQGSHSDEMPRTTHTLSNKLETQARPLLSLLEERVNES